MRDILFKAKRIGDDRWIEGYYVDQYNTPQIYIPNGATGEYCFDCYHIDPNTLCQYTGLTDKNGKKIWENDVVKCNYNDYGEKGTYIGKVIFREDTCTFVVTDGKSTDYEWWNEEKEVIGNIFDNKELIGE